jgi:membrane associated rhomboid family serine protease
MFFFFPYTTDAPLYHLPIATIGLILANTLIFIGMVTGSIQHPENWILAYGDGLHPDQWLASVFSHGGIHHLVGNMIFLWVFGLIVEGKIGWWKFLACYVGIGTVHSMLEQMVMLGYSGEVPGALGASAAIFGIMAMAAVWAPLNEITFFWFAFVYRVNSGTFNVSVYVMAVLYVGWEILMVMLFGGGAASSLLHISGAAVGLPLGIVMLKLKLVDCDNVDLFHIWSGDYGGVKTASDVAAENKKLAEQENLRNRDQLDQAKVQFRHYLQQRNFVAATKLVLKMKQVGGGIVLDRDELLAVTKCLQAAGHWSDSAPFMAELIARFPDGADLVRIKLAQICLVELKRPGKALEILANVDAARVPQSQLALAKKIAAKAQRLQAEGEYELDSDAW